MGGQRHTRGMGPAWLALTLFGVALSGACGFDESVRASGNGNGSGNVLPEVDAGAGAPDANRELTPDAGTQPDANPPVPMGTLTSSPLAGVLDLDGELDAQWQALEFRNFNIADAEQLEAVSSYQADASVRFASLYDNEKLYFFFEVTDDLLVDDSSDVYNDDSVEIYIDGLADSSGPYADDDHWILVGASATYQSLGPGNIEITGFITATDVGYNVEIAMDRSAVGAGTASDLGFNLGLNDDDGAGSTAVDAYGLWFLPQTASCSACCSDSADNYAWCDTTRLGRLQLLP